MSAIAATGGAAMNSGVAHRLLAAAEVAAAEEEGGFALERQFLVAVAAILPAALRLVRLARNHGRVCPGKGGIVAAGQSDPGRQIEMTAIAAHGQHIIGPPVESPGEIAQRQAGVRRHRCGGLHRQGRLGDQAGRKLAIADIFIGPGAARTAKALARLDHSSAIGAGAYDALLFDHSAGAPIDAAQQHRTAKAARIEIARANQVCVQVLFGHARWQSAHQGRFRQHACRHPGKPDGGRAGGQVHLARFGDERIPTQPVSIEFRIRLSPWLAIDRHRNVRGHRRCHRLLRLRQRGPQRQGDNQRAHGSAAQ
jgi:hypothetical protein